MESQIQCPVCTLYLHAGMNLQDHLESHPKEKVIAALVNLTLFQQQSNDECIEEYDCNQYDPPNHLSETPLAPVSLPLIRTIPASVATRTYHQNNQAIASFGGPIQHHSAAPTAHQVMIVDRTRVFHERSNVEINEDCRRRMLANSVPPTVVGQPKIRTIPVQALQIITANDLASNQQMQALRPPPPYCLSVKDNLPKQSGSILQQNEPNARSNENVGNGSELQCNKYEPHELLAAVAELQSVNLNDVNAFEASKQRKPSTQNIYNPINCNDEQIQVEFEDGYDPDDDGKKPANVEENLTSTSHTDTHQEAIAQKASSAGVAKKSTHEFIQSNSKVEKNVERRTAGLQVISNVKVAPNTVLNISSLNSHIGDTVSMKDVFIIGTASTSNSSSHKLVSKASTSRISPHIRPRTNDKPDKTDNNGSQYLIEVSYLSKKRTLYFFSAK